MRTCHSLYNPHRFFFPSDPANCRPLSGIWGGGGRGGAWWVFTLVLGVVEEEVGSRNQREQDGSLHGRAPIVSLSWDWEEKVENCGGGWRSGPALAPPHPPTQPPPRSNLYPPLTPVPQCVAEIRASGQSPHSPPPKNILELSPPFAEQKKVLLIKGLFSSPRRPFTTSNPPPPSCPATISTALLPSRGSRSLTGPPVLALACER